MHLIFCIRTTCLLRPLSFHAPFGLYRQVYFVYIGLECTHNVEIQAHSLLSLLLALNVQAKGGNLVTAIPP